MPRILVIDDDVNMRQLLRLHLARAGMSVELAEDSATGIRMLLKEPPDMIILDMGLPDLGGMEVLRAIKGEKATAHIPVLVLTSRTDDDCYAEAMKLGANAFMTKPVHRQILVDTVSAVVAGAAPPRGAQ